MGLTGVPSRPWKLLGIMALVVIIGVIMESASMASAASDLMADVQIINMLPDALQLHCQSSERDLHAQLLQGGVAARFGWDFYPKIWGRTVYRCTFKWAAGSRWQFFVAWTEQYQECKHCLWLVKPDGFWRNVEISGEMKLVYPWLHT